MPEAIVGAEAEAEQQTLDLGEDVSDETLESLSEEDVNSLLDEVAAPPDEEIEEEAVVEPAPKEEPVKEEKPEPEEPAEEPKPEEPAEGEPKVEEEPAVKPEEEPAKAETPEEMMARLETQNQELLAKLDRQGKQIGRWSNEIGEMRRVQKPRITDEEFAAKMETDPRGAIREEQAQAAEETARVRTETTRLRNENEDFVRGELPDFDELLPEMVEVARKRHNLEDWGVEELKKDPFVFDSREILDIARDVKLARLEAKLAGAETETPKLKPAGEKTSLTEKINKASKKTPKLAGGAGQGDDLPTNDEDLTDEQIDGMDETALNKVLKERGAPV